MIEKKKLVSMVHRLQNGDRSAFGELYETFQNNIYCFILKTVNNDQYVAKDLTQDTFLEIKRKIKFLKKPAAFVTWSKQIANRKCTAYFKKRKEMLADENEDGSSLFDGVLENNDEFIPDEATLEQENLKNTILSIINNLPKEQKSTIILRYFNELSFRRIATIQAVNEETVKSRLHYGRKAIKQSVEAYEQKNNIKLHCTGVVPLLLWAFKFHRISNGLSLTTGVSTASLSTTASTTNGIPVKRIIAGVAAVLLAGGITAGIIIHKRHQSSEKLGTQTQTNISLEKDPVNDQNQATDDEPTTTTPSEEPDSIVYTSINPFDFLQITYEGYEPHSTPILTNTSDDGFLQENITFDTSAYHLSEGDTYMIFAIYDEDLLSSKGYIITETEKEITVTDIPHPMELDPFELMIPIFTGIDGSGQVSYETAATNDPCLSQLTFHCLKDTHLTSGEELSVNVSNYADAESNGYKFTCYTKTITVPQLGNYISDFSVLRQADQDNVKNAVIAALQTYTESNMDSGILHVGDSPLFDNEYKLKHFTTFTNFQVVDVITRSYGLNNQFYEHTFIVRLDLDGHSTPDANRSAYATLEIENLIMRPDGSLEPGWENTIVYHLDMYTSLEVTLMFNSSGM